MSEPDGGFISSRIVGGEQRIYKCPVCGTSTNATTTVAISCVGGGRTDPHDPVGMTDEGPWE